MRAAFRAVAALFLLPPTLALWPAPHSLTSGSAVVQVSPALQIVCDDRLASVAPDDLKAAVELASAQLQKDNLQRLSIDRGEADRPAVEAAPTLTTLTLSIAPSCREVLSVATEANKVFEEREESYTLTVPSHPGGKGSSGDVVATLAANTTLGLVRGLQTFTQLVYALPSTGERYIPNAPLDIFDKPAFPHRALMLDTARNFFAVEDILRTLDAMASVKLNTFHWHATDSQSWPLFVPAFPDLSAWGAYSSAQVYSWHDVLRVQDYAGALGIAVMLEIDMPGHTASVSPAFPDYIACPAASPWATYANEPPTGQLRLGDDASLDFAKQVVQSVTSMARGPYFSTGGDEVNEACYLEDPVVSAALEDQSKTIDELLGDFIDGLHGAVRDAGKIPVVWEEMVLNHDLLLGNDTVVLVWVSSSLHQDSIVSVAEEGYRIIHAASDYFYLDCGQGGWVGNNVAGNSWCDPFKTWQKMYSFDPLQAGTLTEWQQSLVMGGEALLWTEQTSAESFESVVWPRAAAAAEVFWTGGSLEDGSRNVSEALPRLHDWRYRAVARGACDVDA
ncbi:Glucosamine-6-phosphate isomerase (Glucosamine-6-phosphate deaminase) (GNPDA) (GlcN6P deaminase) [Rhodosporidiobolus nylandii]